MKKIFSLLCAMMLVMSSVCAAPKAMAKRTAFPQGNRVVLPVASLPMHKQMVKLQAQNPQAVSKSIRRAPQTATQIVADEVQLKYYATDSDWYLTFVVGSDKYHLDVVCSDATELPNGTYIWADMLSDYCGCSQGGLQYLTEMFTDATLVVSENEVGKCYVANVTTESGAELEISYEPQPIPEPTEYVELAFTAEECSLRDNIDYNESFQFKMVSDTVTFMFAMNATEIAGDYTMEDAIASGCGLAVNGSTVRIAAIEVAVVEIDGGFEGHADVIGWNGLGYSIDFVYLYPVAGEPIDIEADMEISTESFFGIFDMTEVYAESEDGYVISMEYYGLLTAGNYTEEDEISIVVEHPNGQEDEIASFTITYSESADESTITGTLIGSYGQEYNITLTYTLPEPSSQVTLTIADAEIEDATATYGAFVLAGEDAENYVQLYVIGNSIAGTYTLADLMAQQSGVYLGEEFYTILTADVTITVSGTTATVTGTLLVKNSEDASDVVEVTLNLTATIEAYDPNAEGDEYDMQEDVNVAFATVDIDTFNVNSTKGYAYINLQNAAGEMFSTLIFVSGNTLPAGTYPINDTYAAGSVQPGELDATEGSVYPTFYATMTADGYLNVPLFLCVDGTVEVSYDAAGALVLDVHATNTWGNSLHVTLNAATAVENVEAGAQVVKTVKNGQLVIIKNGVEYNAQGAKL